MHLAKGIIPKTEIVVLVPLASFDGPLPSNVAGGEKWPEDIETKPW